MTAGKNLAAAITTPTPDVGSDTARLRTGIAVAPIDGSEFPLDADGNTTGAGYPMPGWWVTIDGLTQALPAISGCEATIEPGLPCWIADVGTTRVILGSVSTAATDYPDWLDDPPRPPVHAHAWATADTNGIPTATETTLQWIRKYAWGDSIILPAAGATQLTIPFDGLWSVSAQVTWPDNTNGTRLAVIKRNTNLYGTATVQEIARDRRDPITAGYGTTHQLTTGALPYIKSDVVYVNVVQTAGGGLVIGPGNDTWIRMHYIGPGPVRARSPDTDRYDRIVTAWGVVGDGGF